MKLHCSVLCISHVFILHTVMYCMHVNEGIWCQSRNEYSDCCTVCMEGVCYDMVSLC